MDALLRWGLEAQFVKKDLKDAFRHTSFATSGQWLLGFHCDGLLEGGISSIRTKNFTIHTQSIYERFILDRD